MPRRIIALAVAALATTGSGVGAIVAATAPAAANAGCTTNLKSATLSNVGTGGPSVTIEGTKIIIDRGTPLATTGAELDDADAFLNCVVANPANVL